MEKQINGGPVDAYPPQLPTPTVVEKVVNLQAAQVSDLKASYAKDYLAYTDNTGLPEVASNPDGTVKVTIEPL